jgi:hypothetical protein
MENLREEEKLGSQWLGFQEIAAILSQICFYGGNRKTKLPLLHERNIHTHQGKYGQDLVFLIKRPCLHRSLRPPYTSPVIPPRVPRYRSFSMRLDPASTHQASGLGFVDQLGSPAILWCTTANLACKHRLWAATLHQLMSTSSSCFSWHHAARTWSHSATGSIKPILLVSPLIRGPARLRPFVPALHLHQCKSSCNLHLQYSAKTHSTPCCQSLITLGSDHPPVLIRSGSQSPHWLVNWQHTKSPIYGRKKNKRNEQRTQASYQNPKKAKTISFKRASLGPLRQGQQHNTTKVKCSKLPTPQGEAKGHDNTEKGQSTK